MHQEYYDVNIFNYERCTTNFCKKDCLRQYLWCSFTRVIESAFIPSESSFDLISIRNRSRHSRIKISISIVGYSIKHDDPAVSRTNRGCLRTTPTVPHVSTVIGFFFFFQRWRNRKNKHIGNGNQIYGRRRTTGLVEVKDIRRVRFNKRF